MRFALSKAGAALWFALFPPVFENIPALAQNTSSQQSSDGSPSIELTPQYLDNLRNCLSGTFNCRPALLTPDDLATAKTAEYLRNFAGCLAGSRFNCKYGILLPADLKRVRAAEYQSNLTTCLTGARFGCRYNELTATDLERVREVEYQANLKTCLGGLSLGCRYNELRTEDFTAVQKAEYKVNLDRCLSAYRAGCRQERLTPEDRERVAVNSPSSTEKSGGSSPSSIAPLARPLPAPACAENGSCYGDTSAATGNPKTVHVNGYYRRDGTYVRGHYRSAPRR
jgi:hypothetical protein